MCSLLISDTCTLELELRISNTITVHLTGFRQHSFQTIVILPQIRNICNAQLFAYVQLTTYHFTSVSNNKIVCALIPPEFSVFSTEKNQTQIHQTQMSLQHIVYTLLHISYYPLLLANIHGHRPVCYLLNFTAGLGLIGKNPNQQLKKR